MTLQVHAVEKSADAERWLRYNVDRYSLQGRVQVRTLRAELAPSEACYVLHQPQSCIAEMPWCSMTCPGIMLQHESADTASP